MTTTANVYPRAWNHDALTHEQLESVVRGYALSRPTAQGICDRRVAVASMREEKRDRESAPTPFVWRLSFSPLGQQLRTIERDRRDLRRRRGEP